MLQPCLHPPHCLPCVPKTYKTLLHAGPWVDRVRQLAANASSSGYGKTSPKPAPITPAVTTSSGSHVTLPEWYGSTYTGMIVPKTKVCVCVFGCALNIKH